MSQPGRTVLLTDGNCGFCRRWAAWVARRADPSRLLVTTFQEAGSRFPQVPVAAAREALTAVRADGSWVQGDLAVRETLRAIPGWSWLGSLWRLPGFPWLARNGYRLIAANRRRLPGIPPSQR